jgi:hypothetical protein
MDDRLDNLAEFYTERMHRVHDNVLGLPALEVNNCWLLPEEIGKMSDLKLNSLKLIFCTSW